MSVSFDYEVNSKWRHTEILTYQNMNLHHHMDYPIALNCHLKWITTYTGSHSKN